MLPYSIEVHESCSSTMGLAKEWVRLHPQSPQFHFIQAYTQGSGRGKRERVWVSEKGNFFGTLVMSFPFSMDKRGDMSFLIAVAMGETLGELDSTLEVQYKWPNDIMLGKKKTGGILLEYLESTSNHPFLSMGMGLNFTSHPSHIPSTCLKEHMNVLPSLEIFRDLLIQKIFHYYQIWVKDGFQLIRDRWLVHAVNRHETIQISIGKEVIQGIFDTINDKGGLILICPNGVKRTFYTGEVFFDSDNPHTI